MPALLTDFLDSLLATIVDVLPIAFIVLTFQLAVLRKVPPNPVRLAVGFGYVVLGLSLFLLGLERALFPLGETMAKQLTSAEVIGVTGSAVEWSDYLWVYAFAAAIGFATTIAEPALVAVSIPCPLEQAVTGAGVVSPTLVPGFMRTVCRSGPIAP